MPKKRQGYLPQKHTKARRDFIDYDYIDKLSEDEKDWLSRFTDGEYGATFEKNPIFVKFDDLASDFQAIVQNNVRIQDEYVQVHGNTKSSQKNLDLRKLKKVTQYFLTPNGNMSEDERYKYSDNNVVDVDTPEKRRRFNEKVRSMENDIYAHRVKDIVNHQNDSDNNAPLWKKPTKQQMFDDIEYELSHEDKLILIEEGFIDEDIEGKG
jgi:hypothetical protein